MGLQSRYSFLRQFNLEALYNTFLGLSPREQWITMAGLGVAILLVFGLPISLASGKLSRLEEGIQSSQEGKKNIVREMAKLQNLKERQKSLEGKWGQGFDETITTTMETLADKSGIKGGVESIKEGGTVPSELFDENSADVKLTKVTLAQLIDYLYNIEHHPQKILRIKQIQIRPRYDSKQLLDVSFKVSTYRVLAAGP